MTNYLHKVNWLLALGLLCASLCHAEPRQKLVVGYFDLPPHVFAPEKQLASPAKEFFNKVAAEMEIEVEYQYFTLQQLLTKLFDNSLDAALILAKDERRASLFAYPPQPFAMTTPGLAVAENRFTNADEVFSRSDLNVGRWIYGVHSKKLEGGNKIVLVYGNDIAQRGLTMVAQGQLDAFFTPDITSLTYATRSNPNKQKITLFAITDEPLGLYTVFSKKAAEIYQPGYEQALEKVKQKIGYEEMLKQSMK